MRREPEHFDGRDVSLVHVSRRLSEAKAVEELLGSRGIDYVVEPDEYRGTLLLVIPMKRIGAFFYVDRERADEARAVLREAGFHVTEEEPAEG